ncbi:MAG: hypothetical protein JWO81_909 [Alphaproteobacteria bacterium]|nr:hypothetical protein [Alphaproteobacteria bacterium]
MLKGIGIICLVVASAVVGPTPAMAQTGEPMYVTHMYSDASHGTEVGTIEPQCTSRGVQYHLVGTYTYFQVDELVGYCPDSPIE